MNTIVLAVVLLGGCFLIHFLMMRKGIHHKNHENTESKSKKEEESEKNHSGHGCCH